MHILRWSGAVAVAAATFVLAGAAQAAGTVDLGRGVASTAAGAEKTVNKTAAIRPAVRDAVKQLIVASGPKPDEVIKAIDLVFDSCRAPDGSPAPMGWTCPATEQAYSALLEIRGVVLTLLESPQPAVIDEPGSAAFSDFPVTTTSGANYTRF